MEVYDLPTGKLIVDDYQRGKLETLSIGDYGKGRNVKADFLGYTRELNGVDNGEILPLQEKWVITLSTQYGCPQKCTFCDVPNIRFNGNATEHDLRSQLVNARNQYPDVKYAERLNIHFARMGEPMFNFDNVFHFSKSLIKDKGLWQEELELRMETVHPVFTTMMPRSVKDIAYKLQQWCDLKNVHYKGQAGLQLSINSTDEEQRNAMFNGGSMTLEEIATSVRCLPAPVGRKYCLNIAYASEFEVDGKKLARLFNPDHWMVKITPIHNNTACRENNIETVDGYQSYHPYKQPEESCKEAGFDVLVFIPSQDEEDGIVTCGNAILGGSELKVDF